MSDYYKRVQQDADLAVAVMGFLFIFAPVFVVIATMFFILG